MEKVISDFGSIDFGSRLWIEEKLCKAKTVNNAFNLLNYLLNNGNAPTHVGFCPDGDIAFDFRIRGGHCNVVVDDKEEIGFSYMDYSGNLTTASFTTPKEVSDKLYQIDSEH